VVCALDPSFGDAIFEILWTTTRDGAVDYANRRWVAVTGVAAEEAAGEGWLRAVHEEDRERVRAVWGAAIAGDEPFDVELRLCVCEPDDPAAAPTHRWHHVVVSPRHGEDHAVVGWVALARDVEARKRSERLHDALAEASARLAESLDYDVTLSHVAAALIPALAEGCTVDILELDGNLHRVATSHVDPTKAQIAERLRELPPTKTEDALQRLLTSTVPHVASHTDPSVVNRWARTPARSALLLRLEVRSYMMIVLRSRGAPIGLLWLYSSVPRTYSREEIVLASELATQAAAYIENARLLRQATEAVRMRDEFLSVASHELNTPLASLQLILESLQRMPHAPSVAARLETAGRQVGRLTRQVRQILEVSRLMGRVIEGEREPTDLATVAREIAAEFEDELARASTPLAIQTARAVGSWDRLHLEQIIVTLLGNAIKYGRGGLVELCVFGEQTEAVLLVRDHGIGVAAEDRERIFQLFERAVSARHYGGLGLGLWIAREIAVSYGGSISLESEIGVGSSFCVRLPLSPPS